MKLYYAPKSISVAVAIALFETEQEVDLYRVDFASAEQTKAGYHQVNPKGRVPALDIDGRILTETGAILEYIAALAPERALVPVDAVETSAMRSVMYYLASTMHVNHAHLIRGARWADKPESRADMTAKVAETMAQSCAFVESSALTGPYVMGEQFTIADAYLYTVCDWLEGDGVDVSQFPKIVAFRTAMEGRASVKHARELGML